MGGGKCVLHVEGESATACGTEQPINEQQRRNLGSVATAKELAGEEHFQ
jgi:hypothetical protein